MNADPTLLDPELPSPPDPDLSSALRRAMTYTEETGLSDGTDRPADTAEQAQR